MDIKKEVAERLLKTLDILNDKVNFSEKPEGMYMYIESIEDIADLIKTLYSKGE